MDPGLSFFPGLFSQLYLLVMYPTARINNLDISVANKWGLLCRYYAQSIQLVEAREIKERIFGGLHRGLVN